MFSRNANYDNLETCDFSCIFRTGLAPEKRFGKTNRLGRAWKRYANVRAHFASQIVTVEERNLLEVTVYLHWLCTIFDFWVDVIRKKRSGKRQQQQRDLIKERWRRDREIHEATMPFSFSTRRQCRELSDKIKRSEKSHIFSHGRREFVFCRFARFQNDESAISFLCVTCSARFPLFFLFPPVLRNARSIIFSSSRRALA